MAEGWYTNSVVYDKNKGGEIMYKSTPDSLVQYISGTTVIPVDIYYGASSASTTPTPLLPTVAEIKTWTQLSGYVGGLYPNPRQYTLNATTSQYQYWVVLDSSGDNLKVVNLLTQHSSIGIGLWNSMSTGIKVTQGIIGPLPVNTAVPGYTKQTICYYLMNIDGFTYRVYRQSGKNVLGPIVVDMYSINL